MSKRVKLLIFALIAIIVITAVIYLLGRLGTIAEAAAMWILLPLMLGIICISCILYSEVGSDEKRNR